jgi:glycine/D-amino acid oxidase-like deaminating enzyme
MTAKGSAHRCKVGVVGAGVVGATIAYELSRIPGLDITVIDPRSPEQFHATGAALGILVGAISQKLKGRHLQMRLASLQRYENLIPELEALTGQSIPYNRQGILELCFDPDQWHRWPKVIQQRQQQGWTLQSLPPEALKTYFPELASATDPKLGRPLLGTIYSPQDRQVHPTALTQALVQAAQHQGAVFQWQTTAHGFTLKKDQPTQRVTALETSQGDVTVDWLVLASGLGTTPLTTHLHSTVDIRPVLGQGLQIRLQQPWSVPHPVVQSEDVHIVPLNTAELWVGATVEFPPNFDSQALKPDPEQLDQVRKRASAICPELASAQILRSWSGLRPRPEGRSAPVVEPLAGYANVLLATGHYRNGILLAPITALMIRDLIRARLYDSP